MVKIDINETEVCDLIIDSLNNKKSLSIIRIGDGEMACLKHEMNPDLRNRFYIRHTGKIPAESHIKEISNNIKIAIEDADIIGITPNPELKPDSFWGLTNKVVYEINKNRPNKRYCDMNLHYQLTKKELLDKILVSVDELYIMTCRDVKDKFFKKYPNIKKINHIPIPAQYLFEENKQIQNFYPERYNEILKDFDKTDFSGKLLLFGGGFIGKNLGVKFAKKGGVSLDLGSVFDLFHGKLTRGKGKGPFSYIKSILE